MGKHTHALAQKFVCRVHLHVAEHRNAALKNNSTLALCRLELIKDAARTTTYFTRSAAQSRP